MLCMCKILVYVFIVTRSAAEVKKPVRKDKIFDA